LREAHSGSLPIPLAPPVITATRPSNRPLITSLPAPAGF
jgi:hypothetical protein